MNKSTQETMFSSATGNWSTPQDFYDKLNWRFGPFDLDPCASTHNTKCSNFFTEAEDGLEKDWEGLKNHISEEPVMYEDAYKFLFNEIKPEMPHIEL